MQENVSEFVSEIRSALRFRWYGMILAWIICLIGWSRVMTMPNTYESRARFYVDTTSVIERVLDDEINTPEVEGQINYIRESLLGRDTLGAVIDEVGLGSPAATSAQRDAMIAVLRQRIELESTGGDYNTPDSIYSITYQNTDRESAALVVSTLLDTFVATTLGENRRNSELTGSFLDERVAEYEERLALAEEALAAFKRENADRLPGAEGDYYERMRTENDELADATREMRLLESKREELETQLEELSQVVAGGEQNNDLPANSIDARIRDYQTQLDIALLQYTDRHPDVMRLRETVEQLKTQRLEELRRLGIEETDVEIYTLGANPVRQAVEIELNDTMVEIATLRADIEDRTARVSDFQGLINELPQVEAQLVQLNRDYEVIYDQYLELVRTREEEAIRQSVDDTEQAAFRIIDPPVIPQSPVGPNRLAYYIMILVGAIAVACGLCYYCAQLWPVFGRSRTLREVTELPVLGAVTHAWKEQQVMAVRSAMTSYVAAFSVLLIVFAGLAGFELFGSGIGLLSGNGS